MPLSKNLWGPALTPDEIIRQREDESTPEAQKYFEKSKRKTSWRDQEDRKEGESDRDYWEWKLEDFDNEQKIAVSYSDYRARDLGTQEKTVYELLTELGAANWGNDALRVRVTKVQVLPLSKEDRRANENEERARREEEEQREKDEFDANFRYEQEHVARNGGRLHSREITGMPDWEPPLLSQEEQEREQQGKIRMRWENELGQVPYDQEILVTYRNRDTGKEDSYSTTKGIFFEDLFDYRERDFEKVQIISKEEKRSRILGKLQELRVAMSNLEDEVASWK